MLFFFVGDTGFDYHVWGRIGTYRNVSECIGGRFFSQKSSPIRPDTFRYVPIRPDTFIFEGFLAKNQGRYVPIRSDTSRYVQI